MAREERDEGLKGLNEICQEEAPTVLLRRINPNPVRKEGSTIALWLNRPRLSRAEWSKTVEFGERNARARGIKPEDIDAEISAARSEQTR